MTAHADHLLRRLGTGKLLGIDHGEGSRVNCVEGAVWITQSNDPRDIVIKGGESFVLDRPGLALVCAAASAARGERERSRRRHRAPRSSMRSNLSVAGSTDQPRGGQIFQQRRPAEPPEGQQNCTHQRLLRKRAEGSFP
jgi:hypothetical protein